MTNKEFFLETLGSEMPVFLKVLKAIPSDKGDYKPHEKARTTQNIAMQIAMQPIMISNIVKTGILDFTKGYEPEGASLQDYPDLAQKNFDQMIKDVKAVSDEDWEKGKAKMIWEGGEWETEKYTMSWGMLFDAIHHRGQLTTYLRAMGAKVPGVYGGSADERV